MELFVIKTGNTYSCTGVFGYGETAYTGFSESKDPLGSALGCGQFLYFNGEFMLQLFMMSETMGIDIHEIEWASHKKLIMVTISENLKATGEKL